MINAYKDFWKRYVDFTNKSNRQEFWIPVLTHIIIIFVVAIIGMVAFIAGSFVIGAVLSAVVGIFALANIIPMIALTMRRFYDAGRKRMTALILIILSLVLDVSFDIVQVNGVAIFFNVVTFICTIILIVIALLPSKQLAEDELKWL
ncbi:DUF805 domain-containing protein [Staphylococcus sp. 18_1_E_LY]|uniref:DUF805 domain-containing protein n=1 Tax=Staphylococcus lloydii TaxID=2781774 RepID=A0A7T1FAD7_9STAP|nr:DUF805 domain-containing protein [Staphylococcus lloydii]MBF7020311.1 DUF805 domain-containing protein [Staphylococcus lloydii]MBF7027994.1 DUF805 domain-containing protein [Staphylococcus lloydii]MDU9418351.1 DUF805 domain-containing protein [Staphylococcus lloydii]QPM75661.1 DUF805 domain-containing protein [Staphylococcus lloydii]